MKYRTSGNYAHKLQFSAEANDGTSTTKPDMTYTPQQLLSRYAQGLPMDKLSNHYYSGDTQYPDMRKMDLVEQQEYIDSNNREIKRKETELSDKVEARRKSRREYLKRQNEAKANAANNVAQQSVATK